MRAIRVLVPAFLLGLVLSTPARAEQPRCPLDLATCIGQYSRMRERPWLGIEVDRDSVTGVATIQGVVPDGPAQLDGIRPGDVLEKIDGLDPAEWFAGRAGWKSVKVAHLQVRRDRAPITVDVHPHQVPEEYLAHIIGVHVLEGHLAYDHHDDSH